MDTQTQRQSRLRVDIPVRITTVLDSFDASIADLTEKGALVTGCSLAPGARFQIEYFGQTLFAQCRWSEVDRMGVQFTFALTHGPLHERLMMARASQLPGEAPAAPSVAFAPVQRGAAGIRTFGRRLG